MSTINYYPKGSTPEQTQGLTEIVPASTPRLILIVAHGIGERNPGDLAGLKESSGWAGWGNIKTHADKYGIVQIYINTSSNYEYKEFQFAVQWAKDKYPQLENAIWILGHSLGSFGFGKYGATDEALMPQIAGWIESASGNFGDIAEVYKNIVDNNLKWWGVTAMNDTVSGTNPIAVTRVYDKVKALKADAPAILTVFPGSEWPNDYPTTNPTGSKKAHNAVLNRLTSVPMYYSGGNLAKISKGVEGDLKMNLYEWMLSNPRGSIYQPPTGAFIGARFEEPVPIPEPEPIPLPTPEPIPEPLPTPEIKLLKRVNVTGSKVAGKLSATLQNTDGTNGGVYEATQVDAVRLSTGKTRYTIFNGKTVLKQVEI